MIELIQSIVGATFVVANLDIIVGATLAVILKSPGETLTAEG